VGRDEIGILSPVVQRLDYERDWSGHCCLTLRLQSCVL
jgi:hypothetical protein